MSQSDKQIQLSICKEDYNLLSEKFPKHEEEAILTAVEEFIDFIKNPKRFSKLSLFQEYRLFLLIKNIYKDDFVSESTVKKIFKIDSNLAKKMISNIKIDYELELKNYNKNSMKSFIDEIDKTDQEGKYLFTCKSQTMIDSLNMLLKEKKASSRKIEKERGSICTYHIYIDEFDILQGELEG